MQMEVVLSFIRQAFLFGGGILVGQGVLTDAQLQAVLGFLLAVIPAAWGLVSKWRDQQKIDKLLDDKAVLKAENKDLKASGFTSNVGSPPPGGYGV